MLLLGCYFENVQCPAEAERWYRLGAQHNDFRCVRLLRMMCQRIGGRGEGVQPDYIESAIICQNAVDGGDTTGSAHYGLASLHKDGHGVPKNVKEALRLYRMAASFGDADAFVEVRYLEKQMMEGKWSQLTLMYLQKSMYPFITAGLELLLAPHHLLLK